MTTTVEQKFVNLSSINRQYLNQMQRIEERDGKRIEERDGKRAKNVKKKIKKKLGK